MVPTEANVYDTEIQNTLNMGLKFVFISFFCKSLSDYVEEKYFH